MYAYLFIELGSSDEDDVIEKLKEMDEIREAHIIFGEWDIIAKVEVNSPEDLTAFIIDKIRTMPEVKMTSTMIVAK